VIAAGSGLALDRDPVRALGEACVAARERCGADRADLCLVFVTPEAAPQAHELLLVAARATGAAAIVGCSAAGVLTERMEFESWNPGGHAGQAAAAALVVGGLDVAAQLIEPQGGLAGAAGTALGARLAEDGPATSALVMPDPAGLRPPELLQGIAEAAGSLSVLGGVASGGPLFELCNAAVASGAVAAVGLRGPAPVVGVAQGCEPIGEPFVITRAQGQVVVEIAGRSALAVLEEAVQGIDAPAERIQAAGLFAGLAIDPAKSPLGRGDFLIRALVGADREAGALALAQDVRVGQTIQFHLRDGAAARADLDATLERVAAGLAGRAPAFGVYFNCAGRGQGLFGVADHDIGRIRARLGDFPLCGFFGNGEFAPVGGRNFFHTYTGVLVVFPGSGPATEAQRGA